ncbi:hypothetical protein GCM10027169_21190 [Gordonia jinhuaensis]|uniref:Uncharacterized protein n=1 Tax=Gordonia jinhuaensis TaxID=1517702 RepID=A0A916TFI0_9ACTN|nr:hypothetical protein [Gordonia jinhuaensis]GGB43329.1 hypothetical protein GCM10011489_33560 [Gordonia jinhuaensis]
MATRTGRHSDVPAAALRRTVSTYDRIDVRAKCLSIGLSIVALAIILVALVLL